MRHYVLTTSSDIVVCFHTAVCSIIPKGKRSYPGSQKLEGLSESRKSENAVADDGVLKFLYDADLRHVESSVRCHRKCKNGCIKVDLG